MVKYSDTKGQQMSYKQFEELMNNARDYRHDDRHFTDTKEFNRIRQSLRSRPKIEVYEDLPTYSIRILMTKDGKKMLVSIPLPIYDFKEQLREAAWKLYRGWQNQNGRVGMDEQQFIMEVMQCAHEKNIWKQKSATRSFDTSNKRWEKTGSTSETYSDPDPQSASPTTPSISMSERFTSSLKGLTKSPVESRKTRLPA